MTEPSPHTAATPPAGAPPCTVTVCRGCCCGTAKLPGVDHQAQLRTLRQRLAGAATVRVTDCLDACDHANVVVVQPSRPGRRAGGRPVWLGLVNDPEVVDDIAAWVETGGPGMSEPPAILDLYQVRPPRRARDTLDG